MRKSNTFKTLVLLAAFVSAGFGANAQLTHLEQSLYLNFNMPTAEFNDDIANNAFGEQIPDEARAVGKFFRKYVGNRLTGKTGTVKQLTGSANLDAEKAAAKFFSEIGLEYFAWPQAQSKPDGLTNRVVLNIDKIRIIRIDKVELDPKKFQLIEGSEKEIPLDSF